MPPPPKRGPYETPQEGFERLRQCFDVLKEKHTDPWVWHEYLGMEPEEMEDLGIDDPEILALMPAARNNASRAKSHLLSCCRELQRASQAADMAYYYISTSEDDLRDCMKILGSGGDIDEDLLESTGDASPEKIMAALQAKMNKLKLKVGDLESEVTGLKKNMLKARYAADERWRYWQAARMEAEEAMTRLDQKSRQLEVTVERENKLQLNHRRLQIQAVRSSRLMLKHGQVLLRKLFAANRKENLFYAFYGFIATVKEELEERRRAEEAERRDAIEFALRNEVRYLLNESAQRGAAVERLIREAIRLKRDRRGLACRMLRKYRPHVRAEYFLWIWELWQDLRREQSAGAAMSQMMQLSAQQLPVIVKQNDKLRRDLAVEKCAHDMSSRSTLLDASLRIADFTELLIANRTEDRENQQALTELDKNEATERIAIMEKEIAEDKHVQSLKGMVIDLESRLRRALDRRKAKGLVVPPVSGPKCTMCQREILLRGWKTGMPKVFDLGISPPSTPGPAIVSDIGSPKATSGMMHSWSASVLEASPS
eukprot:CAMPEP_0178454324 /NCGR_PEP_ID=MMETSP0689_2-20121128/45297_1 /TAXON_ID=160604 /ORGANISM="Amphidinium massartii, Strain CS-259" /LENGTH=541 /DNA_ID=CAMNT_0020080249 /DNA_START=53 /DNA_END=1675 /DNA_ORIENTATION=+